jgi:Tol biopolymer transport system component
VQRALTRLTFDDGLQIGATWSPDGRFIAYSSDRGGKFDIWVQQVSGGNPVQVTHSQANNWQPDWSPDGKYIAYRSEDGEGGLFVIPALGGAGLEREVAAFGFYPRWSPDGSQILFQTHLFGDVGRLYVVSLDGSQPREVLARFLASQQAQQPNSVRSGAWHPDGKKISVSVWGDTPLPVFWTLPVAGGEAIGSEIDAQILGQVGKDSSSSSFHQRQVDRKFSWAPSGRSIYFECTFRGARNLWKMSVDPETLRVVAIERLTTGPGLDTELALSLDGKRLAFTSESEHVRAWLFPFDSVRGRLTGTGRAVTSSGIEAWFPTLTRDGKKLAFSAIRAGWPELWEKSLVDGQETLVVPDDYGRSLPQWSPDGARLAYRRARSWITAGENQLFVWSADTRREEPVSAPSTLRRLPYDWSPDGRALLVSQEASDTHSFEIWQRPATLVTGAEPAARRIFTDPGYDLWQPHFSPNGQWIVFVATRAALAVYESRLHVMHASGGPKIPITDGKYFEDKPRWSPDGRTIYFVSGRGGFFNVWGIRFDSVKGKPVGEPFCVTAFANPGLMVPNEIETVELSLSHDFLVLNLAQASGSIWMLDNVDK